MSKTVAGLLVCKLRTLLIDTLVVLGLRGVLRIVQLNKLGIPRLSGPVIGLLT